MDAADISRAIPHVEVLTDPPESGVVVLREPLEPTSLEMARTAAMWIGHESRAYDLAAAWSPVWRSKPDPGVPRTVKINLRVGGGRPGQSSICSASPGPR